MTINPSGKTGSPVLSLRNQERLKTIFRVGRHYSKELAIAFALAILAAILADPYLEWNKARTAARVLERNRAAVATVFSYGPNGDQLSVGSGLFISSDGMLITNFHVIEGATSIEAKLPSGAFYKPKLIRAADKERDIAIIQFNAQGTPVAGALGNSDDLKAGERVLTIGSPLGLEGVVSEGNISNPKFELDGKEFIQFTAPISPGSSGGGLFDTNGRVIGLTTAMLNLQEGGQKGTAQNLNLAVPIGLVKDTIAGKDKRLIEESPAYYYSAGALAENRRDFTLAAEDFKKAVALYDRYADAYVGLGGVYFELGKYDLEVENYRKAVEAAPKSADAYYYLGTAYEDMGQYEKAVGAYERALQIEPEYKDALHDLGTLYLAMGDKRKASEIAIRLTLLDAGWGNKLRMLVGRQK